MDQFQSADALQRDRLLSRAIPGHSETDRSVRSWLGKTLNVPSTYVESASRWLSLDMRHAATAGDAERSLADATALFRLASSVSSYRPDERRASQQLTLEAINSVLRLLAQTPLLFTPEQLESLAHRIDKITDAELGIDLESLDALGDISLDRAFDQQGRMRSDRAASYYVERRPGLEWLPKGIKGLLAPLSTILQGDRSSFARGKDPWLATVRSLTEKTPWTVDSSDLRALARSERSRPWWSNDGSLSSDIGILPFTADELRRAVALRTRRDVARIAIALLRHRLAHDSWPLTLNDLVPKFLAAAPLDPFDGQPLRLAVVDDRASIWSVGPDRVDDGGPLSTVQILPDSGDLNSWPPTDHVFKGDLVLWEQALSTIAPR